MTKLLLTHWNAGRQRLPWPKWARICWYCCCHVCRAVLVPCVRGSVGVMSAGQCWCHVCRAVLVPCLRGSVGVVSAGQCWCRVCRAVLVSCLQGSVGVVPAGQCWCRACRLFLLPYVHILFITDIYRVLADLSSELLVSIASCNLHIPGTSKNSNK